MEKPSIPLTVAICMVRDAVDIAPLVCCHYLRLGFSRVHFADDGSTDGTFEILNAMRKSCHRVTVSRTFNAEFQQQNSLNAIANDFVDRGYRLIFPFDVDEFWNIDPQRLRALVRTAAPVAIKGRLVNFVQQREALAPSLRRLFSVRHRADADEDCTAADVTEFREAFVRFATQYKFACWSDSRVQFMRGQHGFDEGPADLCSDVFEVYHLPLRSCAEITKRGLNYEPRRAPTRPTPGISWQSRFHREVVLEGRTEAVWEANSVDANGCLNIYGKPHPLPVDLRLRKTLLRAAAYARRHFDCDGLY